MAYYLANEIERQHFCVFGAGAMGLTIASRLAMAGHKIDLVARGNSLAAIKKRGIKLIDLTGEHNVHVNVGKATDFDSPDVLFICTKAYDLPQASGAIRSLIKPTTVIVPIVNGLPWWYIQSEAAERVALPFTSLDPNQQLATSLPHEQIVGSVTFMTAERRAPGMVIAMSPHEILLGELKGQNSIKARELAETLTRCGIIARVADSIRDAIWTKLVLNVVSNPLSVISGATLHDIATNPELSTIANRLMGETLSVASAYDANVELSPEALWDIMKSKGHFKTSMLQDYERGGQLEIAAICGALLELAALKNVDMPFTAAMAGILAYKSQNPVSKNYARHN